jgi:Skp family chaperone for outer membrane proteins
MKSVLLAISASTLLLAGVASAAENKVAYVDVKSAVENTRAYQQGLKSLEALKNSKQKELDALRMKISQSEKDIMGQSMAMSPERLAQKQNELKELRKSFARKQQDAQEELISKKNSLDQGVISDFYEVVRDYGKKNGFDLILPKSAIIYANDALDITGDVTKLLDKKK